MPSSPVVGSKKRPLGASEVLFSPVGRKTTGYCFVRDCPHRGVSCRSLFVVGSTKGLILVGSETLRIFEVPFRKEVLAFLHQL